MKRTLAIAATLALLTASGSAARAADVAGLWINDQRDTKVRLSHCGNELCGNVAWLGKPNDESGKPKTDRHNADTSKRGRPLMGVAVLIGMKPDGAERWSGRIYNADDGETYISHVSVGGPDTLNVQGCVLGGLICKSTTWTRSH
jgi:uncharacterized protein (DUF2147 family)